MSIINKLATSLNRRDEVPNRELAKQIAAKGDKEAVSELVVHLKNKDKNIQSDCIKVLYEIGETNPDLIADYVNEFIALLDSKNNRLQWGAATALDMITLQNPKPIYDALSKIIVLAGKGSVITRDHVVGILTKLCTIHIYYENAFALLVEQLQTCPTNQLPMYAENALPVIAERSKKQFVKTLTSRLDDIEKDTKRKRVEKVISKLQDKKYITISYSDGKAKTYPSAKS